MHGHIYAQELLIGANGQNGNWSRKIPIKKKKKCWGSDEESVYCRTWETGHFKQFTCAGCSRKT